MSAPGRRPLLLGALVGAGALAGGVGLAWWRQQGTAATDPGLQALWALRVARPEGGELVLSEFRGKPLVVNFWATWCAPCVRELPALDKVWRDHAARGVQVLGLAIDGPTPVREFLGRVKIGFPVGLAGLDGAELGRLLGNERGGLPFTVLVDADGRVRQRKLGETSEAELRGWLAAI